jgi:hypothetical protein
LDLEFDAIYFFQTFKSLRIVSRDVYTNYSENAMKGGKKNKPEKQSRESNI